MFVFQNSKDRAEIRVPVSYRYLLSRQFCFTGVGIKKTTRTENHTGICLVKHK